MNLDDIKQAFVKFIREDYYTSDFVDFMLKDRDNYGYDYYDDSIYSFVRKNARYVLNIKDSIDQIQDTFESYCDETCTYDLMKEYFGANIQYYSGVDFIDITNYLRIPSTSDEDTIFDMLYDIFVENRVDIYKKAFELIKPVLYEDFRKSDRYYLDKFTEYLDSDDYLD